jgi:hypothetical protein
VGVGGQGFPGDALSPKKWGSGWGLRGLQNPNPNPEKILVALARRVSAGGSWATFNASPWLIT